MSRARATDKTSVFSLFPFLAVLLCTMGALLVLLVTISHLAREQAEQQAEAAEAPVPSSEPADEQSPEELERVRRYVAQLEELRTKAEQRVREDKARLSHLEDHMRQLRRQLESLQLAAGELEALEEEHYDDRQQAEREVERLQQLIAATRETIEALKEEAAGKGRSYAIVPYEGRNGTRRRPLYIECRANEVILQPEGVRLTPDDFLPPLGPGNPLASALRAAREHLAATAPLDDDGQISEPYPLVLVRPDGIVAYYRVRDAISSWDSDFGYELIDGDWQLDFPSADPQLAGIEHQAVEHARARQRMLAAAAPRAYAARRSAGGGGGFDVRDVIGDENDYEGFSGGPGGSPGDAAAGSTTDLAGLAGSGSGEDLPHPGDRLGPAGSATSGPGGGESGHAPGAMQSLGGTGTGGPQPDAGAFAESAVDGTGQAAGANQPGGQPGLSGQQPAAGAVAGGSQEFSGASGDPSSAGSPGAASGTAEGAGPSMPTGGAAAAPGGSAGTANLEFQAGEPPVHAVATRGNNWALKDKGPAAVPVRRTIQVAVHRDRIAILAESASSSSAPSAAKAILLDGATAGHLNAIVAAVHGHIDEWGIAGDGLYWRPVLLLHVAPDGESRAQDLAQLLKNSGIELRTPQLAERPDGAPTDATR